MDIMPRKKGWQHLTIGQRKVIANMVAQGKAAKEIGAALGVSPTTVSREVRRNRTRCGPEDAGCARNRRFPFVCDGCPLRYRKLRCGLARWRYEASSAQRKADEALVASRRGLDAAPEEFAKIDEAVKEGVGRGDSVYTSLASSGVEGVSPQTVYRWIAAGFMTVKRIDLPKAVGLKKRKHAAKAYDYGGSSRSPAKEGRHIGDFAEWRADNPGRYWCELDYLGSPASSRTAILTIAFPSLQAMFMKRLPKGDGSAVSAFFDSLEAALGPGAFRSVFGAVLTDNDIAFSDWRAIGLSADGSKRTEVFYCDPYRSNQKPHIENKNAQARRWFRRGDDPDAMAESSFADASRQMNAQRLASLGGRSPEELFRRAFGEEAYEAILSALAAPLK